MSMCYVIEFKCVGSDKKVGFTHYVVDQVNDARFLTEIVRRISQNKDISKNTSIFKRVIGEHRDSISESLINRFEKIMMNDDDIVDEIIDIIGIDLYNMNDRTFNKYISHCIEEVDVCP